MKLINDVGVKNSQFWCDNEVKKICLPHKVEVTIVSDDKSEVDVIAR